MSTDAMLPCFSCGATLKNAFADADNQPVEGTEFRTYGHYGSTFWDSMDGEELVLNICDECLRGYMNRLGQHKRFRPVRAHGVGMVGKHWIDRPMVAYSGHTDAGDLTIEPEEIGSDMNVEWCADVDKIRAYALEHRNS